MYDLPHPLTLNGCQPSLVHILSSQAIRKGSGGIKYTHTHNHVAQLRNACHGLSHISVTKITFELFIQKLRHTHSCLCRRHGITLAFAYKEYLWVTHFSTIEHIFVRLEYFWVGLHCRFSVWSATIVPLPHTQQ